MKTLAKTPYFTKTPGYLKKIFSSMVWELPNPDKKELYLTFDDGPTPEVTDFTIETLQQAKAGGTFFCVGARVVEQTQLMAKLADGGFALGNHTYSHVNGWKEDDSNYLTEIDKCAEVLYSNLFRPPYGRIKISQIEMVKKNFHIIMWDVISGDFDPEIDGEKCLQNVIKHAKPGSIVVFHDSVKASEKLQYALPRVLDHFGGLGYEFPAINLGTVGA